jgi:hypothetical protein
LHTKYETKNRDKDEDALSSLFKHMLDKTPFYLPQSVSDSFPEIMQQFFLKQQATRADCLSRDLSNRNNKESLKKRVEEDYRRFKGS